MHERLKAARKSLKLTQEYVAKILNLSRTTIVAIEKGERKVSAEELLTFSILYGISMDELACGKISDNDADIKLVKSFNELSENDKKEVENLIYFKNHYNNKKHEE